MAAQLAESLIRGSIRLMLQPTLFIQTPSQMYWKIRWMVTILQILRFYHFLNNFFYAEI